VSSNESIEQLQAECAQLKNRLAYLQAMVASRAGTDLDLKQWTELFGAFADFSSDWELWIAPNGALLYVSPSCEEITGYPPAAFMERPGLLVDICHEADRQKVREHMRAEQTGDSGLKLDFRIVNPVKEKTVWLSHRCRPVYDNEGHFAGRRVSNRDITGRIHAQSALRKSEERLRRIADCLRSLGPEPKENIEQITALCGRLIGADCALYNRLNREMLCSWGKWQTPASFVDEDRPEGHVCYDVIRSTGGPVRYIKNLPATGYAQSDPNVARYGLVSYLGWRVNLTDAGIGVLCLVFQREFTPLPEHYEVLGILASAIEGEERRQNAMAALRESQEQLGMALEVARSGSWCHDLNTGLVEADRRWAHMLGYSGNAIQEAPSWFLRQVHPADRDRARSARKALLQPARNTVEAELRLRTQDGHWIWTLNRGCAVNPDEQGRPRRIVGVSIDVTERRKDDEALKLYATRMGIIQEIEHAILSASQPGDIAHAALQRLGELVASECRTVVIFDLESCSASLLAAEGRLSEIADDQSKIPTLDQARLFKAYPVEQLRQGDIYHCADIESASSRETQFLHSSMNGVRTVLAVPLLSENSIIGALTLGRTSPKPFTEDSIGLVREVAGSLAIALRQADLLAQTRRDAETRKILLRETNHRVKNNLSAIIGMLYAEQDRADKHNQTEYITVLKRLVQRVEGLAEVHSMLSVTQWRPPLLQTLCQHIMEPVFKSISSGKSIDLSITTATVRVGADQAHHLALILNEIATNTLKHALSDRAAITLQVAIAANDGQIMLEFRDDGPGYPDSMLRGTPNTDSVGFELIRGIVETSLRGTIDLRNEKGAVTRIQFPRTVT